MPAAVRLNFVLFIFCLLLMAACAFGIIYFQEDFEYGVTCTDAPVDSGSTEIPLRLNDALCEWNEHGGNGLLEEDNPARRDYFSYTGKRGGVIVGVKGVDFRHPEGVDLRSNGMSRWDSLMADNIVFNDSLSAIHQGFGLRYRQMPDFPRPPLHMLRHLPALGSNFCLRFYLQVDTIASPDESPPYIFGLHDLILHDRKGGNKKSLLSLQVRCDNSNLYSLCVLSWDAAGLVSDYRIPAGRKICLEYEMHILPDSVKYTVYIDNQLTLICQYKNRIGRERYADLIFYSNSILSVDYGYPTIVEMRVDDILCTDASAGLFSRNQFLEILQSERKTFRTELESDMIQYANNYGYLIKLNDNKQLNLQFQISRDFAWGLPLLSRKYEGFVLQESFRFLNFPNGPLTIRSRVKEEGLAWTNWNVQHFDFYEDRQELRPVVDSLIVKQWIDTRFVETDTIKAGLLYELFLYSRDPAGHANQLYSSIIISHSDYPEDDVLNKGNELTADKGYYISLSAYGGKRDVFIKSEDRNTAGTQMLTGKTGSYVEYRTPRFIVDTVKGYWQTNFRLNRSAKPGTWFIKGAMFNKREIPSITLLKKIVVLQGKYHWWEKHKIALIIMGICTALLLVLLMNRRIIKKSLFPLMTKDIEQGNDVLINKESLDYRITIILGYIKENFTSDISIKTLANQFKINRATLGRNFSRQTNMSINEYINKLRLEKSISLLKDPYLSIKEAAFQAGFNDESYFSNIFKKTMGVSARDYRKNLNG